MAPKQDPIDELYGLPLEDFVPQRDALVKRLRGDGDREGAAAVKKLPKPTRAAWAVNRLAREHPQEVHALVDAGEALAGAQEQLLQGAGADVLRGAADAARRLVDALAAEAPADGPTREKVRATLHAATVDGDVRAEVASGRMVKERSASGFGGLDALIAAAPARRGGPVKEKAKAKGTAKPASPKGARPKAPRGPDPREVRRRRDDLRRAKEAEATAEGAVAGARRALAQVEVTAEARRRDLAEAEEALSEARRRRERAEQQAAGPPARP
jgi:hypothetical protein